MNKFKTISTLSMFVVVAASQASGVLSNSYSVDKTFTDDVNLVGTRMTMAWDGSSYWSGAGGGPGGVRISQYDGAGNVVGSYAPGLDMRSVFTDGSGTVFARQFADPTIYRQTSPGVFTSHVTLVGGSLDVQSAVVRANNEYIAMSSGNVSRWDLSGNFLGNVTLSGFGSLLGEGGYPNNRGIAFWGGYYLTYTDGELSAWDGSGNRVGQGTLVGAGTGFDSHFSFSYANDGRFWVVDSAGGAWKGYKLQAVPEPATLAILGAGLLFIRRRRK